MTTDTKIPDELEAAKFARRIMLEDRQRGFGVYAQLSEDGFNAALYLADKRVECERLRQECIRWQEALRELADAIPLSRLTDPGLREAWTNAMTRLKEGVDAV